MIDWSTDGGPQGSDEGPTRSALGLSTRVAYRLAEASGSGIEELQPLADSVDPEALDAIFSDRPVAGASVTFRHEGYQITVTGDEEIRVDPLEDA